MAVKWKGVFIVLHLLWHGASVFAISSEGPSQFTHFYDKQGVLVILILTRISTGLIMLFVVGVFVTVLATCLRFFDGSTEVSHVPLSVWCSVTRSMCCRWCGCWLSSLAFSPFSGCLTGWWWYTTPSPALSTGTPGSCSSVESWSTSTAPSTPFSTTPCPSSSGGPSKTSCAVVSLSTQWVWGENEIRLSSTLTEKHINICQELCFISNCINKSDCRGNETFFHGSIWVVLERKKNPLTHPLVYTLSG